jgi:diguanylate cyclase (GGDEF)-like protein/PAS domain S-box-containing protein
MSAAPEWSGQTPEELKGLIDSVPAVVYIAELGETGRWHYVSQQIRGLLGYDPDEWTADPGLWFRSIHPDDREYAVSFEDGSWPDGVEVPPAEYRLKTRAGDYVWVLEQASIVKGKAGKPDLWHGVMQDITALKQAESAVSVRNQQQAMTAKLGEAVVRTDDEQELIVLAIDSLTGMDGILEAEIWERDSAGKIHLRHRSGWTGPPMTLDAEMERFPGRELNQGETVRVDDWDNDPRMERYLKYRNPLVASTVLVPISGTRKQFGFLAVNAAVPHGFSAEDEDFLRATASLLGGAIERSRTERSLRHRLLHDDLTELPNRQLFSDRLDAAIARSRATGQMMATLFVDIDHFKLINDGIGHHVGDETLRAVGRRLRDEVDTGDTVARFGGDEFCLVAGSVESSEDAVRLAERLLESVVRPIRFEGSEIVVTASIGIAIFNPASGRERTAAVLLREANAAMHRAKHLGRAQVRVFDEPLRNRAISRLDTERGLRSAIEGGELLLRYQPQISLEDERIVGFEALVRWMHPDRGMIGPAEFIPVAEESGLIGQIDGWVLEEAVERAALWDNLMEPDYPFSVAVNVSARRLSESRLPWLVESLLQRHGLAPGRIALEITETTLISAVSTARSVLEELSRLGVSLAVDDFGTGFSSLSYLSELPIDAIKIDRSFIEQLSTDEATGVAITDAIIRIGKALSMTVVAEGVSDPAQLRIVRDLGCRTVQGYLLGEPVEADQAGLLLKKSLGKTPAT